MCAGYTYTICSTIDAVYLPEGSLLQVQHFYLDSTDNYFFSVAMYKTFQLYGCL